jgi:hypothetical protein
MHGTVRGATPLLEYDAEVEALPALLSMGSDALAEINSSTELGGAA